jgi:hypothetical protein
MSDNCTRRTLLSRATAGGALAAAGSVLPQVTRADDLAVAASQLGTAEHCVMIWLGGGAAQIDTWDPKAVSPDLKETAGSAYPSIATAIEGVQVCEHLALTAPLMDRCVPVRTVHHDVVDEHGAATYRMHTGRPTSETVVYPSLGSCVSYMKPKLNELMPSYVVMGYPSPARSPGFLGAEHGYIYLTETTTGPKGLVRPQRVSDEQHSRRMALLEQMRQRYADQTDDAQIDEYIAAAEQGFRLAGPEFMEVFNLDAEPADLRNEYGDEFGQRCLLTRRLFERGTRFVEASFNLNFVNGTGWDTHNEGQQRQHLLIQGLDRALAALIQDLERCRLLDKTVICVSTEFGRPAQFDSRGGRGHHAQAFSVLLAGGGMQTGQAIGTTDDLAMNIVDRPVSVPDLFATIFAAMGIDPRHELYAGERPVPITDGGVAIAELLG